MKYLFSDQGRSLLDSLTFTNTLYAFDFDGTLAPIVKSPENARLGQKTCALLKELSEIAPVAIISGRSISDLRAKIGFEPHYLIGNHGLEGLSATKESADMARDLCISWRRQLEQRWGSLKLDSGVFLEDKIYSLALHYRRSRHKKEAKMFLFEKIEGLKPSPRIILGKSVMNLIPVGAPHKGVALLELMMKLEVRAALYIGDDDTDEDVFSLPDEGIVSVRVAHKRSSNAKFFVKRQTEVLRIIRHILGRLKRAKRSNASL